MDRIFMIFGATVYIWIHGTGVSLAVLLAGLMFAVGLVLSLRDEEVRLR